MSWGWVLIVGGLLFAWIGFNMRRQAKRNLAAIEEQGHFELGLLGPLAASLVLNDLTPEQLERELSKIGLISRSARRRWEAMSGADRDELGCNQIKLWADPRFQTQTQQFVEEMRGIDPHLVDEAERLVRAEDAVSRAERANGPLDPLTRDLLALKEIDPEGYEQAVQALHAKAAEAGT